MLPRRLFTVNSFVTSPASAEVCVLLSVVLVHCVIMSGLVKACVLAGVPGFTEFSTSGSRSSPIYGR